MKKSTTFDRSQIGIDPEYLVQISNNIDMLNHFYEQEGLGSLSKQYRNTLVASFTTLSQKLQLYTSNQANDTSCMVQGSIIQCKSDLEIYALTKVADLLAKESEDLGKIIYHIASNYRNNIDSFERVLQAQRRKRAEAVQNEKDKVINKFKDELIYRKDYIKELKQRLEQVEAQNSKLYQRLINKAKNVSQRSLSPSPQKHIDAANQSMIRMKSDLMNKLSHRKPTSKQLEQTVHDIMETKQKQQNVKGKRVNLNSYLKTYFRNKFGVKNMAQQMEITFRQSIDEMGHNQQKCIFILMGKMIVEQCDEGYFWEHRVFQQKVTKILKRYLNEKYGWQLDEVDKIYENKIQSDRSDFMLNDKDVQYILINLYKTTQIQQLQMIFIENLLPKLGEQQMQQNQGQLLIPSQRFINQIFNYQLHRHLLRIQDTLRVLHEIDSGNGQFSYDDFEDVAVRMNIANDKIQANQSFLDSLQNRYLTSSQIIQGIQKLRRTKIKKR